MISQADTNARQTPRAASPSTNIAGSQITRFIRANPFSDPTPKMAHRNLPAVPCTTGPTELDTLEVRAGPWKCNSRREFRKRSIAIKTVRHKGDIRARAIRSSASMAGHAAADRFSPRSLLAHNQRIVVDVNGCDELSPHSLERGAGSLNPIRKLYPMRAERGMP